MTGEGKENQNEKRGRKWREKSEEIGMLFLVKTLLQWSKLTSLTWLDLEVLTILTMTCFFLWVAISFEGYRVQSSNDNFFNELVKFAQYYLQYTFERGNITSSSVPVGRESGHERRNGMQGIEAVTAEWKQRKRRINEGRGDGGGGSHVLYREKKCCPVLVYTLINALCHFFSTKLKEVFS